MLTVFRKTKFRQVTLMRKCSSNSNDTNEPASRMIYGNEYKPWRRNWTERPGEIVSKFALFSLTSTSNITLKRILNYPEPMKWMNDLENLKINADQAYIPQRCAVLGPDLALAHFVVYRGGKVKFKDYDNWITEYKIDEKETLPKTYVSDMILEHVDCENFTDGLRYEALDNFRDCIGLKSVSFKGNIYIDDWCLDKFAHIVRRTLECIDIRGTKITHRGLIALAKIPYLKMIILGEDQCDENMELTCAQFEYERPDFITKIVPKPT